MFVEIDVLGVNNKVQKGPAAPKPICWVTNKRGGGRADLQNAGVKTFSSFIWTLVVKKENGPWSHIMGPIQHGPYSFMGPGPL